MTNQYLPDIGDKLQLYDLSRSKGKTTISQMLDIIDDKTYIISGPLENKNLVPLFKNNILEVAYFKKDRGKFFFQATILDVKNKGFYKVKIKRTTRIKKIQQRNYFRLSSNLPATKDHLLKEGKEERTIKEECTTENISGGGIGVLCNFSHTIGDLVSIQIDSDGIVLSTNGEVVRILNSKNHEYKYSIGVKFLDMDDSDREKIIKFNFRQQRKLREKGLI